MDLLQKLPSGERCPQREALAEKAARDWLTAHSDGFELDAVMLERYETLVVPRKHRSARFGIFDLAGRLTVTGSDLFLSLLAQGFGRAKAFGCGLMLIRRF